MSDKGPLSVTAVVGDERLSFLVTALQQEGASLSASEEYDHELFRAGGELQLVVASDGDDEDSIDAVISSAEVSATDDGSLDVLKVDFKSLSEQNKETLETLKEQYPQLCQQWRRATSSKSKALIEIPLEEYLAVHTSSAFNDDAREKVLAPLPDSERRYLQKSGGKGIVAEFLALKIKLKSELDSIQELFSSSEEFMKTVRSLVEKNKAAVAERLERLSSEDLAKNLVAAANQVKGEVEALLAEQESTLAAIADMVVDNKAKSAELEEKRKQQKLEQQATADVPVSVRGKKSEDNQAAPPASPKSKVLALVLFVFLFAGTLGGVAFWEDIVGLVLSSDRAMAEINNMMPVVRMDKERRQLYLYIDEKKIDIKDEQLMQSVADRALAVALENSFTGIRIHTSDGKRLFFTGQSSRGPKAIRF